MGTINLEQERLHRQFRQWALPDYMWEGVRNYISKGIRPGSFLHAVIANDLRGAVLHADDNNIQLLPSWIRFVSTEFPHSAWGDTTLMRMWCDHGGLDGPERHRTTMPSTRRNIEG